MAQGIQIAHVERIGDEQIGFVAALRLFRFDQDGKAREPLVVEEPPKRLETQAAITDMFVPIDATAARPL